jgi:FKBP-type peptidyl-prolyl cis-trans isomerase 2
MKKTLLVSLILLLCILLTGCFKKSEEIVSVESSSDSTLWSSSVENYDLLSSNTTTMDCEKAIQKYLDESDKDWKWEWIKVWDNIVVDYIWRLEDGTVFDTSIESIARACGKYSEGRDYTQWLSFEVWAGQMIKWFDNWVVWMKLWQTKTVKFGPEEWYGQRNEQYVLTYTKEEVGGDLSQFQEWQTIYLGIWAAAKIVKVTDKDVTLDLNHELAGKDLIFDITIKSIN